MWKQILLRGHQPSNEETRKKKLPDQETCGFAYLPYVEDISDKTEKILRKKTSPSDLAYWDVKDLISNLKNGIHMVTFKCGQYYIKLTGCRLEVRIK